MKYIIERIVEDIVFLENEEGKKIKLKKEEWMKEGYAVDLIENKQDVIVVLDESATMERKKAIDAKFNRLLNEE